MLELKDINNLLECLNKLKKEEEQKQLENLKNEIKKELIAKARDTIMHFESEKMLKFLEETNREVCFDYNFVKIMESLEDIVNVTVWEVR